MFERLSATVPTTHTTEIHVNTLTITARSSLILFILVLFSANAEAASWSYQVGKAYCGITHPTEMVSPIRRTTCEEQHVIQQQSGGGNEANTVWWSASSHVRTDVWASKPWENNRPWIVLGFTKDAKKNLEKAYMLGTFGSTWSFFQHGYRGNGESKLIITDFDGVSNLLYGFSWFLNTPQKFLNKTAYIADKGHWSLLIDMGIAVFVLGFEAIAALLTTLVGAVVGTIFNPIDTLLAIPGGLWLLVETTIAAVANYITGIFQFFSLEQAGFWKGIILLPFAILGSFLPFMAMLKIMNRRS